MKTKILTGDVRDVLKREPANSFDGCFCDPPYGLGFMGKAWDSPGKSFVERKAVASNKWDQVGGNHHPVDAADVVRTRRKENQNFQAWNEAWLSEVLRVLKPGAPLLAFGGTRTFHRLACAIEDAGFLLSDTLCWLHGQGFPKGKSQLKPAWEPITLAWKKGPRVLAIDAGRIECGSRPKREVHPLRSNVQYHGNSLSGSIDGSLASSKAVGETSLGRWPANVILDSEAAEALDLQSGVLTSGKLEQKEYPAASTLAAYGEYKRRSLVTHPDSGGASRFFYCAKASRKERGEGNTHPTVKPLKLCEYLARLILPPERDTPRRLLVPFSGSGSEMIGARKAGWDQITGIELSAEYAAIAEARLEAA